MTQIFSQQAFGEASLSSVSSSLADRWMVAQAITSLQNLSTSNTTSTPVSNSSPSPSPSPSSSFSLPRGPATTSAFSPAPAKLPLLATAALQEAGQSLPQQQGFLAHPAFFLSQQQPTLNTSAPIPIRFPNNTMQQVPTSSPFFPFSSSAPSVPTQGFSSFSSPSPMPGSYPSSLDFLAAMSQNMNMAASSPAPSPLLQSQQPGFFPAYSAYPGFYPVMQDFVPISSSTSPVNNSNNDNNSIGSAIPVPNTSSLPLSQNQTSGAYSHYSSWMVRQCHFCKTKKTPEWRRGPLGPKTLCNACGLRFSKHQSKPSSGSTSPIPSSSVSKSTQPKRRRSISPGVARAAAATLASSGSSSPLPVTTPVLPTLPKANKSSSSSYSPSPFGSIDKLLNS